MPQAEANLRALARGAAGEAAAGGLGVVAHVNCMGATAVDACRSDYRRAALLPHVLALDAKDQEGHAMIEGHLAPFLDFLRTAPPGPVLVHCVEGRNRSATLCVAWLMVEGKLPLVDAVRTVFRRRPIVLTNASFLEQLIDLAKGLDLLGGQEAAHLGRATELGNSNFPRRSFGDAR